MQLNDIIKEESCFFLKSRTKTETLIEMIEHIRENSDIEDSELLKKEIFYREQLMSTGLGLGIGIPHTRIEGQKEPIICVGISKDGIEDYKSIDNEIVKIVIMIILDENSQKLHIRLLSQITNLLKDYKVREELINSKSTIDILKIFEG